MVFYLSVQPYFYSYLLVVRRQSPAAAGHITQAFSFSSTVSAVLGALGIRRAGRYKATLVCGALCYLLGIGLSITNFDAAGPEEASVAALVLDQVAAGVGAGGLMVSAQLGVQASAPRELVAAATAVFLMLVEVGGAVGAAVSGAVWTRLVPAKLEAYLPLDVAGAHAHANAIFADVAVAANYTLYPPGSPARAAINRSYQETMHFLFTLATLVCLPLPLLALFVKNYKLEAGGGGEGEGEGGSEGGRKVDGVEEART